MRVLAVGLVRAVKLGLAPCFVLALLIGCDSGGGSGAVPASLATDSQAVLAKPSTLTPQEKRKTKGAARAASIAEPAGAE